MNKYRITSWLILLLLQVMSLGALAAQPATLLIPEALNVVSVNHKEYSRALFSAADTSLRLQPGPHKIVLQYEVVLEIGFEDHEIIKSEPFQIRFSAAGGEQYAIKLPFNEATLDQARAYAKKPLLELIRRSTGQAVGAEITYREFDGSFSKLTQPASRSAAKPTDIAAAFAADMPVAKPTTPNKTGQMPLKMLEYWWQQASEPQRKQFLETR